MSTQWNTILKRVRYESISQHDLPAGRNGKHKSIVIELLEEIQELKPGMALKIPLEDLPDAKANIRSALNRATRKLDIEIATSSDATYFYIWKPGNASAV